MKKIVMAVVLLAISFSLLVSDSFAKGSDKIISNDIGVIKHDPKSGALLSGQKNEIHEIATLIKENKKANQIKIKYKKFFSKDTDFNIEIIYDRKKKTLTNIQNGNLATAEVYKNITDEDIIKISEEKDISSWYYGFYEFLKKKK